MDNLIDGDMAYRASNIAATSGGNLGANKLWLPLWSGEVIHAYDQYNMFENLVATKSLNGGFSWEFPITGTVALQAAWDAGEELSGGGGASKTFKVNLDSRPMAAHFETDNVDLLVTQWDYRSELARQAGLTLANTRDKQLVSGLIAAGVIAPIVGDPRSLTFPAPAVISTTQSTIGDQVRACSDTNALDVLQQIENYIVEMQQQDCPTNDVYCVVPPKVFQVIRALGIPRATNAFANQPLFTGGQAYGGAGVSTATTLSGLSDTLDYMGVKICKTNHIPTGTPAIGASKYNLPVVFDIFAIIFQKECLASLSLMGMKVDTVQDVRRNTHFTVASMLKGTGILRPELVKLVIGTTSATTADLVGDINTRALLASILSTPMDVWEGEYFSVV